MKAREDALANVTLLGRGHRQLAGGARGRPAHVARPLAAAAAGGRPGGRPRALRLAATCSCARRRGVKEQMSRERERLLEENRKLRLEKATPREPAPGGDDRGARPGSRAAAAASRSLVVERPVPTLPGAQLARGEHAGGRRGRALMHAHAASRAGAAAARPSACVRLRIMLMALSRLPVGRGDHHPPGAAAGAGARLLRAARPRARASAPSTSTPRRGAIVDRNGHDLALSVDAESIYAVPQDIEDPERAAAAARARPRPRRRAAQRTCRCSSQKSRAFVWVKRKVDPRHARAVRDLQLPGIGFLTENRRYYPKRELASQVLGYVGLDNTGMSGIEYAFEERDPRQGGRRSPCTSTRAAGRWATPRSPPPTAHTVVLTLDETIQHVAEQELERSMQETSSIAGRGGRDGPAHRRDPGHGQPADLQPEPLRRLSELRAGATARWPTPTSRAASSRSSPPPPACRRRSWTPDEVHRLRPRLDRGRGHVRINDHHVFDQLSFRDVIAKSSDVGVVRVAQRLGRENFNRYLTRLRVRGRDRRRPARRVGGPAAAAAALERAVAGLALLRPGDRRHRAADGGGRLGGGERRLPDEAARSCGASRTATGQRGEATTTPGRGAARAGAAAPSTS